MPEVEGATTILEPEAGSEDPTPLEAADLTEKASTTGKKLIDRQTAATTSKRRRSESTAGFSPGESALLLAHSFRSGGISDEDLMRPGGVTLGGGLDITTSDGRNINITALTGKRSVDVGGKEGFIYTYKDPEKPGDAPEISGEDLAAAQIASEAKAIALTLKAPDGADTPESKLVEWAAKGAEGTPPLSSDEIAAVNTKIAEDEVRENDPVNRRDAIIQESITRLHTEINDAVDNKEEVPEGKRKLLAQLELAQALKGSQIENWANRAVLKGLDPAKTGDLTGLIAELSPVAENEISALEPQLKAAGVTTEEFKLLQEKGLGAILGNDILTAKFRKMENIEAVLGSLDLNKLVSILDRNISEKDRAAWDQIKGGGKLGAGLLLAILIGAIAVPAAAIMASTKLAGARAA